MNSEAPIAHRDHYVGYVTQPVDNGVEATVQVHDGMSIVGFELVDDSKFVIHARRQHGPRIGERVMVGRTLIEVKERRYGADGRLMLLDADSNVWFYWEEAEGGDDGR